MADFALSGPMWANNKVGHKLSYEAIGFYTLPPQIKFDTNSFRSVNSTQKCDHTPKSATGK